MKNYGNRNGAFYKDISVDPIRSITDALIANLGEGRGEFARENYRHLLIAIGIRGYRGKDIRYAKSQLTSLTKNARIQNADGINKKAESFANRLPKPRDYKYASLEESLQQRKMPYAEQFFQFLLEEHPYLEARFIYDRLVKGNMLSKFEKRGVPPIRIMELLKFVPGDRSKKLYVVSRKVENQLGVEIKDPDQFFKSEKFREFPHIAKGNIVLVMESEEMPQHLGGKGLHFIDDLVNQPID